MAVAVVEVPMSQLVGGATIVCFVLALLALGMLCCPSSPHEVAMGTMLLAATVSAAAVLGALAHHVPRMD